MLKKVGMAALAALAIAGAASVAITDADARDYRDDGWRGGHHGQHGWRGGHNRHRDFDRSYAHGDCRTIIIRHDDGSVRNSGVADNGF